jgi:hypothetical protein
MMVVKKIGLNIPLENTLHQYDVPGKLNAPSSFSFGLIFCEPVQTVLSTDSVIKYKSRFVRPNNDIWKLFSSVACVKYVVVNNALMLVVVIMTLR